MKRLAAALPAAPVSAGAPAQQPTLTVCAAGTECTGAMPAQRERPALRVLAVPDAIKVAAQTCLQVHPGPQGQATLTAQGFFSAP